MTKVTPIPKDIIGFVTRFPGLTASGISQLMREKSDWASGALSKLVKAGRLAKRLEKGMTKDGAWRYYPVDHRSAARPVCKELRKEIKQLEEKHKDEMILVTTECDHLKSILDT